MPWIYERPNEYVVYCFVFYIILYYSASPSAKVVPNVNIFKQNYDLKFVNLTKSIKKLVIIKALVDIRRWPEHKF